MFRAKRVIPHHAAQTLHRPNGRQTRLLTQRRSTDVRRGWQSVIAQTCTLAAALIMLTLPALSAELRMRILRTAGVANGETLVIPDCATSPLTISPCSRVARSWVKHLNSRAIAFADGYRAAGFSDAITSVKLDCSSGILARRKTRKGQRKSRHAYGEACDGNAVTINGTKFSYRRAVTDAGSRDRKFFVTFLDGWGDVGPGCVPDKDYEVMGMQVGCRPVLADNCGVIDWRERGRRSQYAHTYHLSYCFYSDPERAYE